MSIPIPLLQRPRRIPVASRYDMLCEKIDNALRDDTSGGAVFDMLPAWAAEYLDQFNMDPGTSGGDTLLDHYMRESGTEQGNYDDEAFDGLGRGVARIGRCVYYWYDDGSYYATLEASVTAARNALTFAATELKDEYEEA